MDSAHEIYVTLPAGDTGVLDIRFRYKRLLKVALDGYTRNIVFGRPPGNGEVEHKRGTGLLKFADVSDADRSIYVLIKD